MSVRHHGFSHSSLYKVTSEQAPRNLLIEKVLPYEAGQRYPVCLTGKRACPPEDCGGIWGYASFLDAIQDPQHPEHEEMLEWVGGEFEPEAFDLDEVNRELQNLTSPEVGRRQR